MLTAALTIGLIATAGAQSPSDPRATFVGGNATTCADVGDTSPNILFTNDAANNSDANVSGTVTGGTTLNLTLLNPNVVVNAVVVKGGNAYNLYNGNFPDMISPLNPGGQLPTISHWFVCYDFAPPPTTTPTTTPPTAVVAAPSFTG